MRDEAAVVGERVAAFKEAWHLNAVRESRVRRFLLGFLTRSAGALIVWLVVLLGRPLLLSAKTLHCAKSPDVRVRDDCQSTLPMCHTERNSKLSP